MRYDEIKRGIVEHAMRVGVRRTRRAYVYPATHYASNETDENLPRMGDRLRLKKNFDICGFSPEAQAILKGLKNTACSSRTTASTGPSRSRLTRGSRSCTKSSAGSRVRRSRWFVVHKGRVEGSGRYSRLPTRDAEAFEDAGKDQIVLGPQRPRWVDGAEDVGGL